MAEPNSLSFFPDLFVLVLDQYCTISYACVTHKWTNECRCNIEDILLEMDRILRPEGAIIFRDEVDVLIKVRKIVGGMRWDTKMVDHEDGPLVPEKILVAVKQYWVGNSTSSEWMENGKGWNFGTWLFELVKWKSYVMQGLMWIDDVFRHGHLLWHCTL